MKHWPKSHTAALAYSQELSDQEVRMAYDSKLADRIRKAMGKQPKLTEREMFGGIGFMLRGNMACGVIGDELMVRIAKDETEATLQERGARIFDFSGRPSQGWIMVSPSVLSKPAELKAWITRGVEYALSLPAK
jgi:TfoX/Sxy family transcriptional regulator of competence genes